MLEKSLCFRTFQSILQCNIPPVRIHHMITITLTQLQRSETRCTIAAVLLEPLCQAFHLGVVLSHSTHEGTQSGLGSDWLEVCAIILRS